MAPTMIGTSVKGCPLQASHASGLQRSHARLHPSGCFKDGEAGCGLPHDVHYEGHLQLQTVLCLQYKHIVAALLAG